MSLFAVSLRRFSILFYLGLTLAGLGALLTTGLFFIAIRELPQVPQPLGRIIETPLLAAEKSSLSTGFPLFLSKR